MKVFIVFFSILIYVSCKEEKNKESECDSVHVHGKSYKKEILCTGINRPYQLSNYNNNVFFSYNVGDDDKDSFEIGYVTKKQHVPKPITNITNGFATAVDIKNGIVYLGGSNGIYVHDIENNKTKHVIKEHNIWDMFFKHHLYFIAYPSQHLYRKEDEHCDIVQHIHEKIYHFAIDGDDDTFIVTRDGLYEIKNMSQERLPYEGPKVFRAIEVNRKGVAYFCGQNAMYLANKKDRKLEEIARIKNIFGLTFDHDDNIIYSDPLEIVKLRPGDCK